MRTAAMTDKEFGQFRQLIYKIAGINLTPAKKHLVCGRLAKRLNRFQFESYGDYFRLLTDSRDREELQIAVDLLTTNETYFFREPKHFDFLRQEAAKNARPGQPYRVWSAASSSGEEAYSIAMTLADTLGERPWDVLGSDLSTRVLAKARTGHYSMERSENIPKQYLHRYCLKGIGNQEGTLLIDKNLRQRVNFTQINLNAPLPNIGEFDVIFIRNVMIYFDMETKRQVVGRLVPLLRRGGALIVGHSESLNGIDEGLQAVRPSIYRKP